MAASENSVKRRRALAVIVFLSFWALHPGQRVVKTQQGPLVRTQGSHITLACNVSGYKGRPRQDFQWSIYPLALPAVEIHIVSTADPHSTYALYRSRVKNGDVYLERTGPDSVLLHIGSLQLQDQGVYECFTPSTDPEYHGTYSDKINLTVIPNTLQVGMRAGPVRRAPGDSGSLSCEVSQQALHHTHLSVSWFLERGGQALEIATLSRNFVLQARQPFLRRLHQGHLRVDKSSPTTYQLTLSPLHHSDQGQVYCQATEWIQDPDKSWYPLTTRRTGGTKLYVENTFPAIPVPLESTNRSWENSEANELQSAHSVVLQASRVCSRGASLSSLSSWFLSSLIILSFLM
ncbi:immunoglobulin superfamily member 3-like [Lepisosteus oculatus]|uniref:immunoglobulin superfamily member 3-like n=1 Tax=Lepisosteus oculatus TaxID=7918 RepID=UPI0035F519FA